MHRYKLHQVTPAFLVTLIAALMCITRVGASQTPSVIPQLPGSSQNSAPSAPAQRPFGIGASSSSVATAPPNFEKVRIGPGFLLHISVFNEPQLTQDLRVTEAGDISLALVGTVHVQGMTEIAAQELVAAAYKKAEMLNDPQVTVSILQYIPAKVSVLGEVQAPGEYEVFSKTNAMAILMLAGGATTNAGNRIILHHASDNSEQVIKFDRNGDTSNLAKFSVAPGDSLIVKRAGVIYVLGAVNRPGGYLMQPDGSMNVIQAISMAADTNFYASIKHIRIIRKTNDGLTEIAVNYKDIVSGKASPQALEPEDIVYVPNSKTSLTFVNAKQLAFQASGAAIYAGIVH